MKSRLSFITVVEKDFFTELRWTIYANGGLKWTNHTINQIVLFDSAPNLIQDKA